MKSSVWPARIATALLALVLATVALGLGLLAALTPASISWNMRATHVLPRAVAPGSSLSDITLLNNAAEGAQLEEVAQLTRQYVMGRSAVLPLDARDQRGYSASVMAHLRDVRGVMVASLWVSFAATVIMCLALIVCLARNQSVVFTNAGLWAAGVMLILMGLVVGVSLVDFSQLFEHFHGLFFAQGSWQFPAESLLIRTFPLQFWLREALIWAGTVGFTCIIYLILGLAGRKRTKKAGFSVN